MPVTEVSFADSKLLDRIWSVQSLSFAVGHVTVAGQCVVVHVVQPCTDQVQFLDCVDDARETLPAGLEIVVLLGSEEHFSQLTKLAAKADIPVIMTVNGKGNLKATSGDQRLAVGGTVPALTHYVIHWFRPFSIADDDARFKYIMENSKLVPLEGETFAVIAKPYHGLRVESVCSTTHCLAPTGSPPETLKLHWAKHVAKHGVGPCIWAEASPFCGRFTSNGMSSIEIVSTMNEIFGIKCSSTRAPGEPTKRSPTRIQSGAKAGMPGFWLPLALLLSVVFFGSMFLVLAI